MCRLYNSARGRGGLASAPLQKAPLMTWRSFLESPQQSVASEKPHMLHSLKTKVPLPQAASPFTAHGFGWKQRAAQQPEHKIFGSWGGALQVGYSVPCVLLFQNNKKKCLTFYINNNIYFLSKHLLLPGFLLTKSLSTLFLDLTLTLHHQYHYDLYFY